jgi:hypothetical protein
VISAGCYYFAFSGYLPVKEAMDAKLLRADEIIMNSHTDREDGDLIRDRLAKRVARSPTSRARVAFLLGRDSPISIAD